MDAQYNAVKIEEMKRHFPFGNSFIFCIYSLRDYAVLVRAKRVSTDNSFRLGDEGFEQKWKKAQAQSEVALSYLYCYASLRATIVKHTIITNSQIEYLIVISPRREDVKSCCATLIRAVH